MAKINDILIPSVTLEERATDGSDLTNPAVDHRRLFVGEDGLLHLRDSAGNVTTPSGGVADQGAFTYLDATEAAAPGTPAAGKVRLYGKSDGLLYSKDDAGVETALGAGGGGSDLIQTASGFGNVRMPGVGVPHAKTSGGSLFDGFDTTDTSDPMTGWTTLGTPTTHNINSTLRSHYYIKKNSAAGVGLVGIYKSWSPAAGDWVATWLTDHDTNLGGNIAGIFIGEAGGAGKIFFWGQSYAYAASFDRRMIGYKYTNRTTFNVETHNNPAGVEPPFALRLKYDSSTVVGVELSRSAVFYNRYSTVDPGFTIGIAGVLIDTNAAGANDPQAVFDWFDSGNGGL